jgi:hypothetical protein
VSEPARNENTGCIREEGDSLRSLRKKRELPEGRLPLFFI